jgi:thiol-disulfide isomerase/thioredoxin
MDRHMAWGMIKDWGTALLLAVAVLGIWRALAPSPVSSGEAPELILDDLQGETFVLAEDASEVTVVNFWATWCAPCRREIPEFSEFAAEHPDVRVLGVSVDDALDTPRLARAAKRLGVSYTVLHDRKLEVARRWGVQGYPTTFILDAEDHVVAVRTGALDAAALESLVESAR